MRLMAILAFAVVGCGTDPVLAGLEAPRLYGGLMFYQGPVRSGQMHLHYQPERGGAFEPVDPPLVGGGSAALSRDGEWIAWVDDNSRIRVRQLRSHANEIVTPSADYSGMPRWSPGGRYILLGRRPGARVDWTVTRRELVIVDRINKSERVLPLDATTIGNHDWSPRDDLLVWQRNSPSQIELATLDGRVIRRISPEVDSVHRVLNPVFSPDGRRIAFVEEHPYTIVEHSAVVVVDLEGRVIARRAMSGLGSGLAWSPSGDELAYCVLPALGDLNYGSERVDVINLQTGVTRTASGEGVVACSPMWGP